MASSPAAPAGSAHQLPIRVYYEDTDFSGAVYHAAYLRFMERGRTEMLRAAGVDQGALFTADGGFGFAVRRIVIDFMQPARMDDELTVETRVGQVGGASLELEQRVLRGDEALVTAAVRVACVARGRAARLPATLRLRLEHLRRG
jgi:acyl-CoA thioester hydrolase